MRHKIAVGDIFYVVCGTVHVGRAIQVEYMAVHILSEDARLFHAKNGTINKRSGRFKYAGLRATQGLYTYEEIEQKEWVNANQRNVYWKMEHVKDYSVLAQVAELIGYEAKPVTVHVRE